MHCKTAKLQADAEITEKTKRHVHGWGGDSGTRSDFLPIIEMDELERTMIKLRQLDFVVSAQAIGSTLALVSETPAILISPDWATKELAATMYLASTDIFDPLVSTNSAKHAFLIRKVAATFDGPAFDANRIKIAHRYTKAFQAARMTGSVEIEHLMTEDVPGVRNDSDEEVAEDELGVGPTPETDSFTHKPKLAYPLFHFNIEHSGNHAIANMLAIIYADNPRDAIIIGKSEVPTWVLMRGSTTNPEFPKWRDWVSCASVFSGGFDALYIAWLLVKIDRGHFGPPKCHRWAPAEGNTVDEQALQIIVRNAMCTGIIREPAIVSYGYWSHHIQQASGVCTDQAQHVDCTKKHFATAVDELGAEDVIRKSLGNMLLKRFGSSGTFGKDDDSSSRFRRASVATFIIDAVE